MFVDIYYMIGDVATHFKNLILVIYIFRGESSRLDWKVDVNGGGGFRWMDKSNKILFFTPA